MTQDRSAPRFGAAERAALDALLAAHAPDDPREAAMLRRIVVFAAAAEDPFARANPEGHLTGSAFVLDPSGRMLLVHHRKLGIWVQPGGHADGERLADRVALREAAEETGLEDLVFHPALVLDDGAPALLDVDVHVIPARPDEPAHEHFDLRFLLRTAAPDALRSAPGEVADSAWFAPTDAAARADPGVARAAAKVARLLGLRGAVATRPAGPGSGRPGPRAGRARRVE